MTLGFEQADRRSSRSNCGSPGESSSVTAAPPTTERASSIVNLQPTLGEIIGANQAVMPRANDQNVGCAGMDARHGVVQPVCAGCWMDRSLLTSSTAIFPAMAHSRSTVK